MSAVDDLALTIAELKDIFQQSAKTVSGPAAVPFKGMVDEVITSLTYAEMQMFAQGRPVSAGETAREAIVDALYAAEDDIKAAAKGDPKITEAFNRLEEKAIVGAISILSYSHDILISQQGALTLRQQAMSRRQRRAQQRHLNTN